MVFVMLYNDCSYFDKYCFFTRINSFPVSLVLHVPGKVKCLYPTIQAGGRGGTESKARVGG